MTPRQRPSYEVSFALGMIIAVAAIATVAVAFMVIGSIAG